MRQFPSEISKPGIKLVRNTCAKAEAAVGPVQTESCLRQQQREQNHNGSRTASPSTIWCAEILVPSQS